MNCLNFRRIEIDDKQMAEECLKRSGYRGSEYTFGNNFVWRNFYNVEICFHDDLYFTKQGSGNNTRFVYPAGRERYDSDEKNNADIKYAVDLIIDYAHQNNLPVKIYANAFIAERIAKLYPDSSIRLERDFCDYIYLAENLETLKGKKLHSKRNHLNRFRENNWSFEPLTTSNLSECYEMLGLWKTENIDECEDTHIKESKLHELKIVECSMKYYNQLDYIGGVLRVNGEVQAFTFGEQSSDTCFVVHVEKALKKYQGAYTAVNNEFVKSLNGKYLYINREDDTGSEGLRKAKLSYNPLFLEEKYEVTFGGNKQ